nr:MAG TPA: hypothetical protein [Caudoviricetes sp.]
MSPFAEWALGSASIKERQGGLCCTLAGYRTGNFLRGRENSCETCPCEREAVTEKEERRQGKRAEKRAMLKI